MYDALYARQSVEKTDSISIESQLEYCRYETRGRPYQEYIDRGYSGKDTCRPAFEQMLADIRRGEVARVIVYKLDRISRSILDFTNMMDVFQKYRVEFVSSTEKFDTAAPIGRAMLNICIVFAQLERETIQKRVADAYSARSRRGFYMGGRIPYGFARTDAVIDGVKTAMYTAVAEEAEQIRLLYSMYADPKHSLGDIVRHFQDNGIAHLRGGQWGTARLSALLRNPVYVQADADVYAFFKSQGAVIVSPASGFTGENACYLYAGAKSEPNGRSELRGREVVLAPHAGIVPSRDWLACRTRCLGSRCSTRTCKPQSSWLAGKVKCGRCGGGLTVVRANTRRQRYFVCSAALSSGKTRCAGTGGTVYAGVLEEYIQAAIRERLKELPILFGRRSFRSASRVNQAKIRLAEIDEEIGGLPAQLAGANDILQKYINDKAAGLDAERRRLEDEIRALSRPAGNGWPDAVVNPAAQWDETDFEGKQAVVDALIRVITVADGHIEIMWNF